MAEMLGGKKLGLIIIATALAAACSSALAATPNAEFRVGVQSFVKSLDAQETESNAGAQVMYNLYDTLLVRDLHSVPMEIKPGLAQSWKKLDPTTWEFKLRSGVKFHDGSTLTAQDVAYSLGRSINKIDPRYASTFAKFFNNFQKVEAVNDLTVRVHMHRPDPLVETLLSDPNAGITSKAYTEKVGLDKAAQMPISTGPYKVVQFTPGQKLVLERFEDYWGPAAPFKRLTYTLIPEIAPRITALVNKEVDFIVSIPPDQDPVLASNKSVRLVGTAWPMFHVLVTNMSHPEMKNRKLRQAMSLAIDRNALTRALWLGKGAPAKSLQFPDYGKPMYMKDIVTEAYNPTKAAQLVKESGYDGTKIVIYNQANYYTYFDLGIQAVIEMWKKVGIKAELKQVDSYPKDYSPIMMRTWSNPLHYPDPMGVLSTHWTEFSWPATRGFFTPSKGWDQLYETARYSLDVKTRQDAYRKLLEMAQDDAGFMLLYQPYESFGMRSDVRWRIPKNYRPYTLTFRAGDITLK